MSEDRFVGGHHRIDGQSAGVAPGVRTVSLGIPPDRRITALAFSENSQMLVAARENGTIDRWDLAGFCLLDSISYPPP